ncbi:hypothetical protein [Kineosporia sp. A_224]|uniref:hypothetical protein n=1 Tax=Kineosporia sp. A_224 TaxID=1962180 RepID=UPI000B4ABB29|nr:hypothetical protein [Kineosporia sp. A_224]
MIVHKKTLAVSTAALLMTGGVAYAFISATSVSGSGTAGTATASTALVLTTAVGDTADPFSSVPNAGDVVVVASSSSTVALTSPSSAAVEVAVTLDAAHAATCEPGSFTATFTGTPASVPAGASGVPVGFATVVFNEKPVDQAGCIGAELTLAFSTV